MGRCTPARTSSGRLTPKQKKPGCTAFRRGRARNRAFGVSSVLKIPKPRPPVSPAFGIPHYEEMFGAARTFDHLVEGAIASGSNLDTFQWLRSLSIDPDHVTNFAGLYVETEITALPGGIFSFAKAGFTAFVMLVCDSDAVTPIDLIAFTRDKPRRAYRFFGYADALGVDQLYNPASYFADSGLMIRHTPLDWLIAGCNGCVILDHSEFAHRLRTLNIPQCRLVAENVIRAREIAQALSPLPDHVRIFIPEATTVTPARANQELHGP
jgi:hypothetical protein